jgi:hypothetical protein
MKRFTKKVALLLLAMVIAGSVFAEKRYVFVLGGFAKVNGVADPGWKADWQDFRLNDVDRVLYIWASGETIGSTPAVGVGALGQTGYNNWLIKSPAAWWGCGYYEGPASGNPNATMDMSDITSAWTFNFSIRTNCATNVTINVYGTTVDPTDPFLVTPTNGKILLSTANLPLSKRDGIQWVDFHIPLSQLMTGTITIGTPPVTTAQNLIMLAPFGKGNYLTFGGGNDTGSTIAWDNVYFGAPTSDVKEVKVDKLEVSVIGNELTVKNNTNPVNIFNVSGACVLSSKLSTIDISNLASGLYIVRAGNSVTKFNK